MYVRAVVNDGYSKGPQVMECCGATYIIIEAIITSVITILVSSSPLSNKTRLPPAYLTEMKGPVYFPYKLPTIHNTYYSIVVL